MGYKILGFVVWQVSKWYLHRRYPGAPRKLAIGAGVGVAIAAGGIALAASRRSDSDSEPASD